MQVELRPEMMDALLKMVNQVAWPGELSEMVTEMKQIFRGALTPQQPHKPSYPE